MRRADEPLCDRVEGYVCVRFRFLICKYSGMISLELVTCIPCASSSSSDLSTSKIVIGHSSCYSNQFLQVVKFQVDKVLRIKTEEKA